jgi:flagellar basal-body rod modification protein FlgD
MTTTNTTTTTAGTGAAASTTSVTNPKATLGKDDFLKLMVAQLKYQNPLSPSDQSQMMSQMAQFSMVEGINNVQATLRDMGTTDSISQAVGLIGKQLTFLKDDGTNGTGAATSVAVTDGTVIVHVGDTDVPLANVLKVTGAPTTSTTTSNQAAGA